MTKKSNYLLGILLTIGIGTLLYYFLCCNCRTSNAILNPEKPIQAEKTNTKFSLKTNGFNYQCNGNFTFLSSSFKTILPVVDSINIGIENLKPFLQQAKQKLTLVGACQSSEKNNSIYENLGLARAIEVKNYFVSKGIAASSIETEGIVQSNASSLDNQVTFSFREIKADVLKEDFTLLKSKINTDPLILYFNTGQTEIDLSETDRKKVSDLVGYLDKVADSKIDITGYTDNVGKPETNRKLGLERADFAKKYFVANGIAASKIVSASKGSENPLAPNTTANGRAKNRRVEVKMN